MTARFIGSRVEQLIRKSHVVKKQNISNAFPNEVRTFLADIEHGTWGLSQGATRFLCKMAALRRYKSLWSINLLYWYIKMVVCQCLSASKTSSWFQLNNKKKKKKGWVWIKELWWNIFYCCQLKWLLCSADHFLQIPVADVYVNQLCRMIMI